MGGDCSKDFGLRFSRSSLPNRLGMVAGDQPVLELLGRLAEDCWDEQPFEGSLLAIVGALISAISRGGLQCNTTRFRREENLTFSAIQPCLEGQSSFA
jgi:hypothetical protein